VPAVTLWRGEPLRGAERSRSRALPASPLIRHVDLTRDLRRGGLPAREVRPETRGDPVESEIQYVADQLEGAWVRAFVPLFVRRFSRERLRRYGQGPSALTTGSGLTLRSALRPTP
jgi:hypothetical protein